MGGNHTRQILEAQPEQTMAGADGLRRESGEGGAGRSPIREQKVGTWQRGQRCPDQVSFPSRASPMAEGHADTGITVH